MRGPPGAEGAAARRQLTNQIGQAPVIRVAPGLGVQHADHVSGRLLPVPVELRRPRVEEREPGGVRGPNRAVEHRGVQGVTEPVHGQHVGAPVTHPRGCAGDGVQHPLHTGPHLLRRRASRFAARRVCRACQVEQVRTLGLVELQPTGQCVQHALRGSFEVAALQAGVVVHAEPGQQSRFLAAKPAHPPVPPMDGQPRLLRGQPGPPGDEERTHLVPGLHVVDATTADTDRGRPCQYLEHQTLPDRVPFQVPSRVHGVDFATPS